MGKESWDGLATSDDLLCEHNSDIELALKTGPLTPSNDAEKAEVAAETKEFGDDEPVQEPGPNDQEYKP